MNPPDEKNKVAQSNTVPPTDKTLVPGDTITPSPVFPASEKKKRNRSMALDNLPDKVKEKFDSLIATGKSYREIVHSLKMEFKGRNAELDALLDSSETTYRSYIEKNEGRIKEVAAVTTALTTEVTGGVADMKVAIDSMVDPTTALENKKQALHSLYEHCASRLRLIELRQGTKFLDPQYEQLIITLIREQRGIVETLVNLQDELKKEGVKDFYAEFKSYTSALLVGMNQCYKEIWGDEKFADFHAELERKFNIILDRWLADRNVKQ